MPHFCHNCGADEYICQECAKVKCSRDEFPLWLETKRTGRDGNVCPTCVKKYHPEEQK